MVKTPKKNASGGIYYEFVPEKMSPIGVVLCLTGTGQRTLTNYSLLDSIEPSKQFDNGLEVPFIVIVAAGNPNSNPVLWMKVDYTPFIDVCKTYNLPMHVNGLSLGAMCLEELVINNPGTFKTVASIAGLVNTFQWPAGAPSERDLAMPEFSKIPSKFYYGTLDTYIKNGEGYSSMLAFSQLLQKAGADNQWMPYPGRHHDIWPDAYTDYWPWLQSKTQPVAPIAPTPDPVISLTLNDGVLLGITQSGKKLTIIPTLMP